MTGFESKKKMNDYINENSKNVAEAIDIQIIKNNEIIYEYGNGNFYDIASLTKVISTILVLKMHEVKTISINDKVSKYLIMYKHNTKIFELLNHSSGIRDEKMEIRKNVIDQINEQELKLKTIKYADYNFILLFHLLETIGGIEELLKKNITSKVIFNIDVNQKIEKTEIRKNRNLVHGEVHDQKAFEMHGVSAHAGLFCNITDFNKVIVDFLQTDLKILDKYYVENKGSKRTIGFISIDSKKSMGPYLGKALYHTGFTGTSTLIDIETKLIITIFTNRIYPTRDNEKIHEFRKKIHYKIYQELNEKNNNNVSR